MTRKHTAILLLALLRVHGDGYAETTTTTSTEKPLYLIPVAPPPSYEPPRAVRFDGVDEAPAFNPANRWQAVVPWSDPHRMETINAIKRWKCIYEYTRCIRRETYFHRVCTLTRDEWYYQFVSECDVHYWNCLYYKVEFYYIGDGMWCDWNKRWVVEDKTYA